ncbi:MAG: shikimate dehydrogenase family protein, partial [Bacteroidia bacterium]
LGHTEESSGLGHTEESSGLGHTEESSGPGNAGRLPVSQKLDEHPGRPRRALVVGTGGSARAVACALTWLNIPFDLVGRNLPLPLETALPGSTTADYGETTPSYDVLFAAAHLYTYPQLSERSLAAYDLIVHCTPLGMDPGFAHQRVPLDLSSCAPGALLYDLVYTPSVTPLMQEALDCGLRVCGGLAMLEQQAEAAWRLWKG